jgi:hypothetical protein
MQLLDLPDGDRAIRAIKDPFDQTALRIPGAIGKLRHAKFFVARGIYLALLGPSSATPRYLGRDPFSTSGLPRTKCAR